MTTSGYLPEGIHECTLEEFRERFGQFQRTDRRCRLFEQLAEYVRQAKSSGLVKAIIVDGSYVTRKDDPNDIDLIIVSIARVDMPQELRPVEYNSISKGEVRRQFGIDALLAEDGSLQFERFIRFFAQVREDASIRKGIVRIDL